MFTYSLPPFLIATLGETTLADVIYQAQPPLEFIPPAFNPLFLRVVHL